jgi:lipopolysaccharide export LptBFGC system permease protein LptF
VRRSALKPGGHLDRYVGSLYLASYVTAFLIIVGLFLILDMASNLEGYLEAWADGSRAPTLLIVRFYLLQIPFLYLQVAPFITLVAGQFTVAKLLKHSETVAALAAGVSAHRLLAPVFLAGFASAAVMFALRELATETIADRRDEYRYVLEHKQRDRVYTNVRVRDLSYLVELGEYRPAAGSPPRPEARGLDAIRQSTSQPWTLTEVVATTAVYEEHDGRNAWRLEGGLRRESQQQGLQREEPVQYLEGFDFTPRVALAEVRAEQNPLELSFGEARELSRRDPDNVVNQTLLQYHLTFPLACVVLLLVGVPLLLRHEKKGIEGLAQGSLLCVFYFAVDFICRNLGLQGGLDPMLAAWLPVLVFGSLGLVFYDAMRT